MYKRKTILGLWCAMAVLLVIGLVACNRGEPAPGPAVTTPAAQPETTPTPTPTAPPAVQEPPAPAPLMPRLVEEVVFIEEPDFDKVIDMIEAGEVHLYASGTSDAARERRIRASPVMDHEIYYGLNYELTFNPVGPTFPGTGDLNPFHVPAIREAMNWLVDRDHIVEEIYGGLAAARYLPLNTTFPDYARLADVARALELRYRHDPQRAREVITREMEALGATLQNDRWHHNGQPVRLIFLIRPEDERRNAGDYIATLLEDLGFTVDRQYRSAAEASPIWIGGDPAEGRWHIYTGGWASTIINRDLAGNFNFYYTARGRPEPLWQAYTPSPEFDEVSERLGRRDYPTWEERQQLMARAVELAMEDSVRIWLVDSISVLPRRSDISVASDLAGGISASALWPHTLSFVDPERADQRVTFASPSLLTEPWNPVAGTNWLFDLMIMRATTDFTTMPDPFTGLSWPQRIEGAEVYAEEGSPVTITHDWLTLEFVPSIDVPPDAWVDWDAVERRFITAGEQHPEGLTSRSRTVVHYVDDLFSREWHDGTRVSLGDMVASFAISLDRGKGESALFDESAVPSLETFLRHFRGLRIIQEDPLVVEVYSDQIFPDAETIAASRAGYLFTSTPWHALALGVLAEQNRELAFSSSKADRLRVEWMSYIAGPSLSILGDKLAQAQQDGFIPYAEVAGQYISPEEVQDRYQRLAQWRQERGHYWVSQGPYYLHSVHPTERTVVIRRAPQFPDAHDKWLRFSEPRIAQVDITGPVRVNTGEAARFEVEVTFQGQPYPVEDVDFVRFLVLDAHGELIAVDEARPVADGLWEVELSPQQTGLLEVGSSRLEVVVVSRLVSIPSTDRASFVAVRP